MNRILRLALLATGCSLLSVAAMAQDTCAEGRMASGQCVDPLLAESMRQMAVIFSQPKLSYTHYPVLPSLDWTYRYPNELNPNPLTPSQIGPTSPTGTIIIIP